MGDFSKLHEARKETRLWDRTVKEILAKFFFDLSKLVFAAIVLGGFVPIFTDEDTSVNWLIVGCGTFITVCFAVFGYKILKSK